MRHNESQVRKEINKCRQVFNSHRVQSQYFYLCLFYMCLFTAEASSFYDEVKIKFACSFYHSFDAKVFIIIIIIIICHDGCLSVIANALTVAPHININHLIFLYGPMRLYLDTSIITMRATHQIMRNVYENESNGRTMWSILSCTKQPACKAKNAVVWPRGTYSSYTRIMFTLMFICVCLDCAECA